MRGDLPINEAFEFYLNELAEMSKLKSFPSQLFDVDFESFKKNVFSMTGGRMWFITDYIGQVHCQEERIESPKDFEAVNHEETGLELKRAKCKDYTRDDFNWAIRQLADSPSGYVDYEVMLDGIGDEKLSALIRDNVLYYRPPSKFARDLVPPPDFAVVTAVSQPALLAMRHWLTPSNQFLRT